MRTAWTKALIWSTPDLGWVKKPLALPRPVDAMGIARLLDEQQPDNMNNSSALTEEVSKNNDPKRPKAKQIFLGIDAHLASNQVARKKDNSAIQGVQSFSVEELLLFAQKQLSLAEEV